MNNQPFLVIDAFRKSLEVYFENFSLLITLALFAHLLPILNVLLEAISSDLTSLISFMMVPASFALYVLFFIALIKVIAKYMAGESVSSLGDLLQEAYPLIWKGLGGYILFLSAFFLGIFFLILPGICCAVFFYFFIFAQVIENEPFVGSFHRSFHLVKGNLIQVLKAHGAVLLFSTAIILPIMLGMKLLWVPLSVQKIIATLLGLLILPLITTYYYQLFQVLQRSKEGQLKIHESLVPRNTP